MSRDTAPQVRRLTTLEALTAHLDALGVSIPIDTTAVAAVLGAPLEVPLGDAGGSRTRLANRFCVLPMEGWDATADGRPTELVERRWRRFGESGAALVWGGEAVAVRADGRANPNQLCVASGAASPEGATSADLDALRRVLLEAWTERSGTTDGLLVGLQLTHSGRFARPTGSPAPRIAYRHPALDDRVGAGDASVLSDAELDDLVGDVVAAADAAHDAGFAFVDVKACHGYLGHELLSAVGRPGPYGGDLDGRTRFLRLAIEGIHRDVPELGVGVRLSAFDARPFGPDPDGTGRPDPWEGRYPYTFGGDGTGLGIDLDEVHGLLDRLTSWGVGLVCMSAGSPYYNPHIQRPAYFPPSDGYTPPEDPLVGVARQIAVTAALTRAHPDVTVVGSGYSYLQEWIGPVAAGAVGSGATHLVGLGRVMLSYPDLPTDLLTGHPVDPRRLCRTFSDCTTAPRNGLVSGCYPLDDLYKHRPERAELVAAKKAMPGRAARDRPAGTSDGVAVTVTARSGES